VAVSGHARQTDVQKDHAGPLRTDPLGDRLEIRDGPLAWPTSRADRRPPLPERRRR
jgi:hypothetical protein